MSRRQFLGRVGAGAASAGMAGALVDADPGPLRITVPPDGGTPRTPGRIVPLGERAFRIHAEAAGGDSPLTHAVSRVDLVLSNSGGDVEVCLHIDLSGDGRRTNFDGSPE